MILPTVKHLAEADGICEIPQRITYFCDCDAGRTGAYALASFLPNSYPSDDGAFIEFGFDGELDRIDEIYSVTVLRDKIKIGFRDTRGAVNGAASVALLLRKKEVRCGRIVDYPSTAYRSLLVDLARGLPEIDHINSIIRYMALAKYNRLHLHLIDSRGPCYISDAVPEFVFIPPTDEKPANNYGQYEKSVLANVARLCRSYAIEIVPEIEIPAHGMALCAAHPEFKCEVENAHSWTVCPGNGDLWEFFDRLIGEVVELFPDSQYIHIGSDELEFSDLPEGKKRLCHWDECPRCAELRMREGLSDRSDEFYYVIERIHGIVTAHGKKMMMWNDQLDVSKDVPISRDILIEFWRVAYPGRGPHEGCTFDKLLEKGFRVVNATYRSVYLDMEHYFSPEKMKLWTPFNTPEQSPQFASQIIGGEACAWETGNYEDYPFYRYTLPPSIALFGDKLWSPTDREHDGELRASLSEFIFGSSDYTEIFDCVGDLVPPRDKARFTYLSPDRIDSELIDRLISRLENATEKLVAQSYTRLLSKIKNEKNITPHVG